MNPKLTFHLLTLAITILLAGCGQEKEPVTVTGVTLSQASLSMIEGDTQTLSVIIEPADADNKFVTWNSNRVSVASVQEGVVTAHKEGTALITVKTDDGGKTAFCEVTVNAKIISVTSVTLDKTSVELTEGDEITLTATVAPENATNKNVIWESSDNDIVSVNNGRVVAHKAGKAIITVMTEDSEKTASCEVKVKSIILDGGIEGTEDWWYVK